MLGSAGLGISWLGSLRSVSPAPVLSLIFGAIAASLPLLYLYVAREVRFRRCDALSPDAVDLMARGLRAGHAVPAVLEMVGQEIGEPLAGEFRILHEEQNLGLPLRDAILNLVDRVPRDDMRFLATAILLQKETGGNLAVILDKTASSRGSVPALRPIAHLHRSRPDHGLDSMYRAIHHVRFDEHGELEIRTGSVHESRRPKSGLHGPWNDASGDSGDSQDHRHQGLNHDAANHSRNLLVCGLLPDLYLHDAALLGSEYAAGASVERRAQ